MQIHVRNQTYELDVRFAIFLLGLYIGIDLYTVYVCLSHMIRAVLDRASGSGEERQARTIYQLLSGIGRAHAALNHRNSSTKRVLLTTAASLGG